MGDVISRRAILSQYDDNFPTETSQMQSDTEDLCGQFYKDITSMPELHVEQLKENGFLTEDHQAKILRQKTVQYLYKGLSTPLGASYTSLDASRPWLIYWMLHALDLLEAFPEELAVRIRESLRTCGAVDAEGAFGGGFMQSGHTATTYAAVLAICILGDEESFRLIDRQGLYRFFMKVKDKSGGFRVQKDGEMDTRGLYTVLAISSILNIMTPELVEGCAEFVGRCQTYEGGMGGEAYNEAHGGYAFCAVAALCILDRFDTIDVDALTDWVASRQMSMEGGFQGRTNKLVDSCYSFWQGAIPAMLEQYLGIRVPSRDVGTFVTSQIRLEQYILVCCQFPQGGLRDKPGKNRDQYHTCYSLSGLSVAQQNGSVVWGDSGNKLKATDPVYNVEKGKLKKAMQYFAAQPKIEHDATVH
mmetsp:Transcript_20327/g.33524  ORF Transcript_20327/g.33524 Transcript_20327/m.33524 type:complete len:416 (+) Transcript_20327:265-1512(+)